MLFTEVFPNLAEKPENRQESARPRFDFFAQGYNIIRTQVGEHSEISLLR